MLARFLMTAAALCALSTLTACAGEADKADSADTGPLVADQEVLNSYGVRCPSAEELEAWGECYSVESDLEVKAQPGELFTPAGTFECPDDSAEAQLLLHVQVNGFTPDDGINTFGTITITFHCGDVPPEKGAEYTAEEWLVGDMGTVLHVVAEADFVLE
jgi:hypothetical protein